MHQVLLRNTGEQFICPEDSNVLAAMEKARCSGIPVGCRNGGCGACKVRVATGEFRTGKMNRAVVSEAEQAEGCTLACRTFPISAIEIEVLGRVWQTKPAPRGTFSSGFSRTAPNLQPDKET